mmetsp:Transcript_27156/g.76602  ORF Transcript_27156/g.76602 Transcript_27156/m.76602 type:complete len:270 (+) Transcript_27156:656-1465(+)
MDLTVEDITRGIEQASKRVEKQLQDTVTRDAAHINHIQDPFGHQQPPDNVHSGTQTSLICVNDLRSYLSAESDHFSPSALAAIDRALTAAITDNRRCYNCGAAGHLSYNCPKPLRPSRPGEHPTLPRRPGHLPPYPTGSAQLGGPVAPRHASGPQHYSYPTTSINNYPPPPDMSGRVPVRPAPPPPARPQPAHYADEDSSYYYGEEDFLNYMGVTITDLSLNSPLVFTNANLDAALITRPPDRGVFRRHTTRAYISTGSRHPSEALYHR